MSLTHIQQIPAPAPRTANYSPDHAVNANKRENDTQTRTNTSTTQPICQHSLRSLSVSAEVAHLLDEIRHTAAGFLRARHTPHRCSRRRQHLWLIWWLNSDERWEELFVKQLNVKEMNSGGSISGPVLSVALALKSHRRSSRIIQHHMAFRRTS